MSERDTTLRDLIQDNVNDLGPGADEDGPFFLTGAVLLAEWVDAHGDRWFVRFETDEEGGLLPTWRGRGLAYEYLEALTIKRLLKNLGSDE